MEEIYNQYLQYDFQNSEEYIDFKEKFPLEPNETIEEHQKRFYKSHICHEFDMNYRPPQSRNINNNQRSNNEHRPNINNQRNNNNRSHSPPLLEIIDYGYLGLSLITLLISKQFYTLEIMIYFMYRMYFATGWPRFNIDYLKTIVHNNNFNFFILSLVLWITQTNNILIILPMTINTSLYLLKGLNKYSKHYILEKIISFHRYINTFVIYFEIFNIISPIIGIFLGLNKFYFILVYLQYIKFRYYASSEIRDKINEIRVKLEIMRTNSNNPIIRGFASFIQKIGNAVSSGFVGGNVVMINGGIMACNIF
jgi:hypothetical protein